MNNDFLVIYYCRKYNKAPFWSKYLCGREVIFHYIDKTCWMFIKTLKEFEIIGSIESKNLQKEQMSYLWEELKDTVGAIYLYQKGAEITPDGAGKYMSLAAAYMAMGKHEEMWL